MNHGTAPNGHWGAGAKYLPTNYQTFNDKEEGRQLGLRHYTDWKETLHNKITEVAATFGLLGYLTRAHNTCAGVQSYNKVLHYSLK